MRTLAAEHPDTLRNAEWEIDQVGLALLWRGRARDALEMLRRLKRAAISLNA